MASLPVWLCDDDDDPMVSTSAISFSLASMASSVCCWISFSVAGIASFRIAASDGDIHHWTSLVTLARVFTGQIVDAVAAFATFLVEQPNTGDDLG